LVNPVCVYVCVFMSLQGPSQQEVVRDAQGVVHGGCPRDTPQRHGHQVHLAMTMEPLSLPPREGVRVCARVCVCRCSVPSIEPSPLDGVVGCAAAPRWSWFWVTR
jgi:hypothetical protein